MTDDTSAVPPALSPDEFSAGTIPMPDTKATRRLRAQITIGGLSIDGRTQIPHVEIPALIALGNAALPDSDPRKIRHEDVALLRKALWVIENEPGPPEMYQFGALGDIANKLAALLPLPPEP